MHIFSQRILPWLKLDCDPKAISPYLYYLPQHNNMSMTCFGGLKTGQLQKSAVDNYLIYEWHFAELNKWIIHNKILLYLTQ